MAYEKFNILESTAVPLPIENIDTDQIIPARFLKATERKGFGENLFRDWRYNSNNNILAAQQNGTANEIYEIYVQNKSNENIVAAQQNGKNNYIEYVGLEKNQTAILLLLARVEKVIICTMFMHGKNQMKTL